MKKSKLAIAAALAGAALPGLAAELKLTDGMEISVKTTATAGTIIRTSEPSPSTYALIPSTAVADVAPGQLVGQTGGSDLNFEKGDPVSTVIKAMTDIDVHGKTLGFFIRIDAWKDLTLGHSDVRYGNAPNGFTPNTPLSDRGFAPDAKFSNIRARDVYFYKRFGGDGPTHTDIRVGRQVLNWGVSQFFTGGLGSVTNPYDTAAQFRPGALPQESRVPVGMLSLSTTLNERWGFDAYVPFEFRPGNIPGCGTFFDVASVTPQGCNVVGPFGSPIPGSPLSTPTSLTEHSLLESGYYLHRNDQDKPDGRDQYGVAIRYTNPLWNTDFRAYAAKTDSTLPNIYSITIENVNGATLPAGIAGALQRLSDPSGMKYGLVYPEGIQVYGISFEKKLSQTSKIFSEASYRKNQPIGYSPIDLLLAGLLRSPTSLLQVQKDILSVPAGETFEGFDRYPVITANAGGNKTFRNLLGADHVALGAELGLSHINGLPDPSVFRYGRGLAYGGAPYLVDGALTACTETMPGVNGVPGKTCTYDGYITSTAWGVRGKAAMTYDNVIFGADLTLALTLAKDVRGYSYDATFSQGRMTSRISMRADWSKKYFFEAAFTDYSGGNYNLLADRSNLALVAGATF